MWLILDPDSAVATSPEITLSEQEVSDNSGHFRTEVQESHSQWGWGRMTNGERGTRPAAAVEQKWRGARRVRD